MVIHILVFLKDGTQLKLDTPLQRFHPLMDDTFLVGYVECKKDTPEVLEASIMKQLNDSLAKPFQLGRVVLWKANGEVEFRWPNGVSTGGTELVAIPVEVYLLGDTAFLSTILGRNGMAMHWCNFCWLKRAEWQSDQLKKGSPILMAGILGTLKRSKADDVEGCKSQPLLTNITLGNMFVGVLHCVDLHVNFLVKRMFLWIRWQIETAPQELELARNALAKAMMDEVEAKVEVAELEALIVSHLNDVEELNAAGLDRDTRAEVKTIKAVIKGTRDTLTVANTALSKAKSKATSALAKVNRISKMKEYNATTQPIRQRVEERLQRKHYVYRSSYHGGDLEGNQCRRLIRDAVDAVNTIKEELKTVEYRKATDPEINEFFKGVTILLQCFDLMSSLCYQPYGSRANKDIKNAKQIVVLFHKIWRCMFPSVPPKTHMWVHLLEHLDRTRGLKFHTESPVEVEHQTGKRDERRFGNRDRAKKVLTMLQSRANKKLPAVLEQQEEVAMASKRKFRDGTGHQKNKKQKRAKATIDDLEKLAEGYTKLESVEQLEKMHYQVMQGLKAAEDAARTEEEELIAMYEAIETRRQRRRHASRVFIPPAKS